MDISLIQTHRWDIDDPRNLALPESERGYLMLREMTAPESALYEQGLKSGDPNETASKLKDLVVKSIVSIHNIHVGTGADARAIVDPSELYEALGIRLVWKIIRFISSPVSEQELKN